MLDDGAAGLAVLGTTSEANSLTLDERRRVIDTLVEDGVAPGRLLPGTGASAIDDAVALTRHVGEIGGAGVLLLPPFYYKNVSDEGLYAFVATVIERCGPKVPRILLYHFPAMAAVGWSIDLVGRLLDAFPGVIAGMKDSSGDAEHTRAVIDAFPGFAMFPGSEIYLLQALQWGAVGCISATANVNARTIAEQIARYKERGCAGPAGGADRSAQVLRRFTDGRGGEDDQGRHHRRRELADGAPATGAAQHGAAADAARAAGDRRLGGDGGGVGPFRPPPHRQP